METFGGKIFDILDKHPEKLLKVEGVGQKRCDLIARSWTEQKAVRNAVNFLIDHEVSSELAVKIVRTYGIDTVRIVKEDPYRLARDLRRIDFHWADAFAKRIGIGCIQPCAPEPALPTSSTNCRPAWETPSSRAPNLKR